MSQINRILVKISFSQDTKKSIFRQIFAKNTTKTHPIHVSTHKTNHSHSPNLDEDSEHQIHQKWQYLETKVIQLKRRYFPSSNLINNYDSDAGISQKYFEILEELNLEQKTNKVITKLDHPFGLDPASQTKLLNLEHSQPPLQTAQSQILPRKAQNSHFLSNTSCRKIKRTHTFKLRTKNRQVKRFSDLVNKTASKIYLTRPKRQEYHGRIALLAKELEYLSLQIQGKRLVNHKKFNKRRPMVIGNFWVIQAKREKALNEIMGGRRRRSIKRSKRKTGKSIDFETMRLEYNKSLESVRERGKRRTSSSKPSHFNFTPKTPEPEEVLGKGSELVLKVLSSSKKVLGTGGPLSNLYETPNKTSRTGFIKFGSSKNKSGMGPGSSSSSSRREALCKKIEKRQKRRLDVVFDYYSESSQKRQLEADRMVEEHCVDEFNTRSTMDSLLLIGKSRKKPKVEIGDVISPIRERPSRMIGAMRRKTDGEFASSPFDFDA